jgi:hypothetical protein
MNSVVQSIRSELRRLAQSHDPLRAAGEWAEAWKLIDQTAEQRLRPAPAGRSEPVAHFAGGERRSPVCPECGSTEFRHVEWTEHVRQVYGFDAGDVLRVEGLSRDVPEAAFGEHLWCEGCDAAFELPVEMEYE